LSGSIKLKHASGNGVIISAPSSNPAVDRTLTLPSDSDGVIAKTDADGNITMGDFASPTDLNSAQVPTLFVDRVDNNIFGEDGALYITQNAYFSNSGSYKRVTTARPLQYKQRLGKHKFLVGDSGSAGGNVTFSEKVIIDADGLKFNGDTSSANALTDYEEGFWSPTGLDGMNLSIQNTSDNASRRYMKIGRQVFAYFDFTFQNLFNTHTARFGGLPYAQATSGHQASAAAAMGFTTKGAVVYVHISGLYPTFFKSSGTAYNYNEVSSTRMAGVLIYTTD
jgi:hypothetical protein